MAQVQQDNPDADPITQAFIVDRQAFWNSFTRFVIWSVVAIVALLIGMWLFIA